MSVAAAPISSSTPTRHSHLKDLDYSVLQQCMHCGLCLPTCPTYDATKLERNSPRGRIALMRAIADDRLEPSKAFADEMYFCLGCLACMTACPAGVNYAELFEHARAEAEASGVLNSPKRSLIRTFTLRWLFMDLNRLQWFGTLLRLYQQLGIQALVRSSGILEVLARNGCEVITPPDQSCCGSLHAHNGEWELAQDLARRQIDQFPPEQFDAIITNAGGCGSHLKHYHKLLADDRQYRKRAELWDTKVKDIHEWLVEIGFQLPAVSLPARCPPFRMSDDQSNREASHTPSPECTSSSKDDPHRALPDRPPSPGGEGRGEGELSANSTVSSKRWTPNDTVTYHESCHLCHGQKITTQPRE